MVTLCIRYRIDPTKRAAFEDYARALPPIVTRCGGRFVDYYLPTPLAGSIDTAIGLIDFPDLAAYEAYRRNLGRDAAAAEAAHLAAGAILNEERSFMHRAGEDGHAPETAPPPEHAEVSGSTPVERMYFAWDEALSRNDSEALLALYAEDARLESPLIPHLLGVEGGVLNGHDELRCLFALLADRKPPVRRYSRTGYLTDGRRLIWEYPRATPEGEQMDFAEVMELNDRGLIQRHCVYWGWFGVRVLQRDQYRR